MRRLKLTTLLNCLIIIYLIIWVYFLIFNWDVFSVRLNTYLGFTTLSGHPFVFFFGLGLLTLLIARIYAQIIRVKNERLFEADKQRTRILEKELEITRLRSAQNSSAADWENDILEIKKKIEHLNRKIEQVDEHGDDNA